MDIDKNSFDSQTKVVPTVCASHCGGSCLLKVHVKDGVITKIETDDGEEPQLRGCLRGRSYRQRVYHPDRLLYPMKQTGKRGEGKFERISWDEALDTVASQLIRVRDAYGPAAFWLGFMPGDVASLHRLGGALQRLFMTTGCWSGSLQRPPREWMHSWGVTSYGQGIASSIYTYGTSHTCNTRDDLVNSKLIIAWGWDPATTVSGPNTCWYMAQAKEAGAKVISVDPKYTDTAATFADRWIPIRPGTDCAMLIAMAYVMIKENIFDKRFIDTYTIGFDHYLEYVMGIGDGVPKTPSWAEEITGVPSSIIAELALEYATLRPAALMAGIAPGRTAYGEQFHRAAIALAAMTANVGVNGGDAAGRSWESIWPGYEYKVSAMKITIKGLDNILDGPDATSARKSLKSPEKVSARRPVAPAADKAIQKSWIHPAKIPDAMLRGECDYKLLYVTGSNPVVQYVNTNTLVKALELLEFIVVQEQFMTPTARYADILLPMDTYMERNDIVHGVGTPFIGMQNKAIEPLGECKSQLQIADELGKRMGIPNLINKGEEEYLGALAKHMDVPDYDTLKQEGTYRINLSEPEVVFKKEIEDPANNPFPTPSGKIEIYSQRLEEINHPGFPPIPKYIESWEGRNDPLAKKYPLQLVTSHFKRRALSQFDNIPWLRELQTQAVFISTQDADARYIKDGDMVRVFNDRGEMIIRAKVTERIMPGVVDVPHGAWYDPDANGIDWGGSANVLTSDDYSPSGGFAYNTALVEVSKSSV